MAHGSRLGWVASFPAQESLDGALCTAPGSLLVLLVSVSIFFKSFAVKILTGELYLNTDDLLLCSKCNVMKVIFQALNM